MKRKIVKIDATRCTGCGACAEACHEGAIEIADGKARLMRDDYCDGLGACLPSCPADAITIEEREADAFNEEAVKKNIESRARAAAHTSSAPFVCPGAAAKAIARAGDRADSTHAAPQTSRLSQWPVQIKLVPTRAPWFDGAKLLVAADCTAYAYGDFHERFIKGRITLIGCPKLDDIDYSEKLTAILRDNEIRSVTVVRMEVPCCGGLEMAVKRALADCGKMLPWQTVTISTDGEILDD